MYSWYKLRKFYPAGFNPTEWWDRKYEGDGEQWSDPEEYRRQLFYPLLMEHLKPGKKYLDAGCGLGGWLAFLRARGMDVVGIESSRKAVEMVKKLDPSLPVQVGDVRKLAYPDESFDGYMAIGTWEYLEDGTEGAAREAKRVIKPGGMLFIEVPYANPFRRWTYLPLKTLEVALRTLLGQKAMFSNHIFRKGDIRVLLEGLGFEMVAVKAHDLPEENSHYGLWIDWPFFRGKRPYELNALGQVVKKFMNSLSPWMIATGMFVVARKK
ncbi:MAG: class I SAM-dependent methyltransferase [Patescibacteria group bacterium]